MLDVTLVEAMDEPSKSEVANSSSSMSPGKPASITSPPAAAASGVATPACLGDADFSFGDDIRKMPCVVTVAEASLCCFDVHEILAQ